LSFSRGGYRKNDNGVKEKGKRKGKKGRYKRSK